MINAIASKREPSTHEPSPSAKASLYKYGVTTVTGGWKHGFNTARAFP